MPLAVHADSAAQAFARAGEAMLRRTADAVLRTMDYEFAGKRAAAGMVGLEQITAQSSAVRVVALRADVDAAPVDLFDDDVLSVDGVPHRIVSRVEQDELGQVTFLLSPVVSA